MTPAEISSLSVFYTKDDAIPVQRIKRDERRFDFVKNAEKKKR